MATVIREGGLPGFMQKAMKGGKGEKAVKGEKGGMKKGGKGKSKSC